MASSTDRVPRLIPGADLTSLPLSPLEGFVLSRIDGAVSLAGLADLTSLEDAQVIEIVEKLIGLEAVEWARETVSLPLATGRRPSKTPSREVEVPESLRRASSRPRRVTAPIRITKPSERPGGTYRTQGTSEHVETRASGYPNSAPRASHTGSIYPAGEVVDPASSPGVRAPTRSRKESASEMALDDILGTPIPSSPLLPQDLLSDALPLPDEPPQDTEATPEDDAAATPEGKSVRPDATSERPEKAVSSSPAPSNSASSSPASSSPASSSPASSQASSSAASSSPAPSSPAPSSPASSSPASSSPTSSNPAEPNMEPSEAPSNTASSDDSDSTAGASTRASRPISGIRPPGPAAGKPESLPLDAGGATPSPSKASPPEEEAVDPRDLAPESPEEAAPVEEEELDLPEERRKRIDDLYIALELLDHYQVLGVERSSNRKTIRTAYFALSKVFHPDTMFRKRLGAYKGKMEAIFQRLTEAYEVLGKKKPRLEYDRYLETQDRTRAVEADFDRADGASQRVRAQAAAQAEVDAAAGGKPKPAPSSAPPTETRSLVDAPPEGAPSPDAASSAASSAPPAPEPEAGSASPDSTQSPDDAEPRAAGSSARRKMSAEAIEKKKKLMASRLRGAVRASNRVRRPKTAALTEPPADVPERPAGERRERALRDLASTLKGSMTGVGSDRARRLQLQAERAEREGDLTEAAHLLRQAVAEDPEREAILAHHERVEATIAAELADSYEEQARYETKHGKWGAAALSWSKVAAGRPDDAEALRRAADALLKAKGDLHKASDFARRAVELAPDDVRCMRVLARVYIEAQLPLNARRILERASELDPNDQIVENLLRDLKG